MVVIRLARRGSKKRPFYHVVVADKRAAVQGKFIEKIGYFNPIAEGKEDRLILDIESTNAWIAKGAAPSPRVRHLIKEHAKISTTTETHAS